MNTYPYNAAGDIVFLASCLVALGIVILIASVVAVATIERRKSKKGRRP